MDVVLLQRQRSIIFRENCINLFDTSVLTFDKQTKVFLNMYINLLYTAVHVNLFEIPFQKSVLSFKDNVALPKRSYRLVHSRTTDYPMNLECT